MVCLDGKVRQADRERIEQKLRDYRTLRARLRNQRGKVRRFKRKIARQEYTLSAVDYSLISQGKTGRVAQRQQEWVAQHLDQYPELMDEINKLNQLEEEVQATEDVLDGLRAASEAQYKFLCEYYFNQNTMLDACQAVGVSRPTGYSMREKILNYLQCVGW